MKKIVCILLVICCFILSSCSNANNDESKIDGLSLEDYIRWGKCYFLVWQIEGNPTYYPAYLYGKEPGSKLMATDLTERLVNLINHYLFDHQFTENEKIKTLYTSHTLSISSVEGVKKELKSFGITDENRLTVDWIVNNPYDSYQFTLRDYFMYIMNDIIWSDMDIHIVGTVYNLNVDEYTQYVDTFLIKFDDFTLTRYTYQIDPIISKFNECFWSNNLANQDEEFAASLSVVESYGLSKDNPITDEWIVDNPYEAYHMMNDLPESVREEIFTIIEDEAE